MKISDQSWADHCGYGINDPWDMPVASVKSSKRCPCEYRFCVRNGRDLGVVGFVCDEHNRMIHWVTPKGVELARKKWRSIQFS